MQHCFLGQKYNSLPNNFIPHGKNMFIHAKNMTLYRINMFFFVDNKYMTDNILQQ